MESKESPKKKEIKKEEGVFLSTPNAENKKIKEIKEEILKHLREVIDPEMNMDIVSLGLIYNIEIDIKNKKAIIEMTFTTPTCPLGDIIIDDVKFALSKIKELDTIDINITFDPPWTPERLSPEAKEKLGFIF